MWKQKEPRSVTHGREAHSIVLARVWGRFGSAQRVPTGQGEAGALAKLKADRGAHWSNEEPKDCPVPQECNSPPPSHTQAPRTNPVGHSPSGEDLLSLSLVFPNGERRIIWAQPTHSSPFVQSPEHSQTCPYLWFLRGQQENLSAHPCPGREEQGEQGVENCPAGLVPSVSVTKAKSVTERSKNKK